MNMVDKTKQWVMPTYGRFDLSLVKGSGSYVWDEAGKSYLDFATGIAVCSLGHCHPALVKAIQNQAEQLWHVSNLYYTAPQADLAELISKKVVGIEGKTFFSNSGAEANEGLIKLARNYGEKKPQHSGANKGEKRHHIITLNQSFHGRTNGALAATGQDKIQAGCSPLLSSFSYATMNDIASVEALIRPDTVAVMLEPVQGESGIHAVTAEFLIGVEALCKQHDLLLLLDEVQCGVGRCGEWSAWQAIAPQVVPDAISWAKGLGGGVPIGAFWVNNRNELSEVLGAGKHGSTYGGNPLVCSVALEVLNTIESENLLANVNACGAKLKSEIESWGSHKIVEVRGLGLMLGIQLVADLNVIDAVKELMADGLLTVMAGTNTMRLLPPLNLSESELEEALIKLKSFFN